MNYKTAIENKKNQRKNALIIAERSFVNALQQHPELRHIEKQLKDLLLKQGKGQKISAADIKALEKQKADFLKKIGLSKEFFNPPPSCSLCCDTGYSKNKICGCIISLVAAATTAQTTFDDFSLNVFNESDKPSAKKTLEIAQEFCRKFPFTSKLNLLLYGKPGTGKTFLASCIADDLSQKGFSVIFTTAFGFLNKVLAYHTALTEEKYQHIAPLIDCELLIIDDIGTENMLKNVTQEYFYLILNERISLKRRTIITTNLDEDELTARYSQRTASRLFDKNQSLVRALANNDLRK